MTTFRGNITDINGKQIATNKAIYTMSWYGTGKRKLTADQLALIIDLKQFIHLSHEIEFNIHIAERQFRILNLIQDLPMDVMTRFLEKYPSEKNIVITQSFKRLYPYNTHACHIIGYVSNNFPNISGKTGLERYCDDLLQGEPGQIVKTINSCGKLLNQVTTKKAISGQSIQTTIDIETQKIAEQLFPTHLNGACIILDPKTGALETIFSRPAFNPNIFIGNLTSMHWQEIQAKRCLLNRASFAAYPPASLYKLVTLAASLEEKLIKPESVWTCKGKLFFGGRMNYCARRSGHGLISTRQALAYSCNIPFYELAQKLKIDTLATYANKLGLGTKTGFLLGEHGGLIPTEQWKKKQFGEPWWPGESLSAAIGQSFLLTTPLQIGQMIGALCTGSLVKPRILASEAIVSKPLQISLETRQFLKEGMAAVAEKGTARILRTLIDFKIYAKTGTAQTSGRAFGNKTHRTRPHVWFAAHCRYKKYPPKVIVLLLEHATSVRAALEVARQFLENYAAYQESCYKLTI